MDRQTLYFTVANFRMTQKQQREQQQKQNEQENKRQNKKHNKNYLLRAISPPWREKQN